MLSLNDGCGKSTVTGNEWIGVKFIALLMSSVLLMLALSWENQPCTSKPGRLDAKLPNHDLELHSLHTLLTSKFKIRQLHTVRLY